MARFHIVYKLKEETTPEANQPQAINHGVSVEADNMSNAFIAFEKKITDEGKDFSLYDPFLCYRADEHGKLDT